MLLSIPKGTTGKMSSLLSIYILGINPSPSSLIVLYVSVPSESVTNNSTWDLYFFFSFGIKPNLIGTKTFSSAGISPSVFIILNIPSLIFLSFS